MTQPTQVETRAPTATNQKSAGEPNQQRGARQAATISIHSHLLQCYLSIYLSIYLSTQLYSACTHVRAMLGSK